MSVCVCVRVSCLGARARQAQADTGPSALPDQQRSCPCSRVLRWHPKALYFPPCFAMTASALRKTAKSAPCGSQSPGWPTNPRQTPTRAPKCLAPVLDSEHGPRHQPWSSLFLFRYRRRPFRAGPSTSLPETVRVSHRHPTNTSYQPRQ